MADQLHQFSKLAEELVGLLELDGLVDEIQIAGPGFVNLRVRSETLVKQLEEMTNDLGLSGPCGLWLGARS